MYFVPFFVVVMHLVCYAQGLLTEVLTCGKVQEGGQKLLIGLFWKVTELLKCLRHEPIMGNCTRITLQTWHLSNPNKKERRY